MTMIMITKLFIAPNPLIPKDFYIKLYNYLQILNN